MGLRSTRWSVIAIVGALALTVGACGGDDDGGESAAVRAARTRNR